MSHSILSPDDAPSQVARNAHRQRSVWRRALETPHTLAARKVIFNLHMWTGVALSLYFVLMSLTGTSLVFRDEMETFIAPAPEIEVKKDRLSFQGILQSAEQAHPGYKASGIINTIKLNLPVKVYVVNENDNFLPVLVNQYSGHALGLAPENPILDFLQELHTNLLLERKGRIANAVGGSLLCFLCVTGLILWWKGLKTWTRSLQINIKGSTKRINWDLHNSAGFWLLPFVLIWGISAIYFGFRPEFAGLVNKLFPGPIPIVSNEIENANKNESADRKTKLPLVIDDALAIASRQAPGQWIARVTIPRDGKKNYQVWLTEVGSYRKDENTEVDIEQASGRIVSISRPNHRRPAELILIWLTRLHFGNFGGVPIKIIWVCLGISPAMLAVTGLIMWWHRSLHKQWFSRRAKAAK